MVLVVLGGVTGCKGRHVQSDVTGVSLAVHYDGNAGLTSLTVSGFVDGAPAFPPGTLPDPPRPLTKGTETLAILLPDGLAGKTILIRVDGLAANVLTNSGAQTVALQRGRLVSADVMMGDPAVCGDMKMRAGFEQCLAQ